MQNDHYVAALGHQIVIYKKETWAVQCVIPSKLFSHPYGLQFLSEHIFIVKNNYCQYMVYDVLKKEVLWKFKPRGYSSIDIKPVVLPDGKVYDILTERNYRVCCSQIVITPETQKYEIRDLTETVITFEGWQGQDLERITMNLLSGLNQKLYMLNLYHNPQKSLGIRDAEYVLFEKDMDVHSPWQAVKQWKADKRIKFKFIHEGGLCSRNDNREIIYFDDQCIVWNDLTCEEWRIGNQYCFDEDNLTTPISMTRKCYPQYGLDFWLFRVTLFSREDTQIIRQYKTGELVPPFYDIENWLNEEICDVAVLDSKKDILIGTMTGLFLCKLLT